MKLKNCIVGRPGYRIAFINPAWIETVLLLLCNFFSGFVNEYPNMPKENVWGFPKYGNFFLRRKRKTNSKQTKQQKVEQNKILKQ